MQVDVAPGERPGHAAAADQHQLPQPREPCPLDREDRQRPVPELLGGPQQHAPILPDG